jgi:hypothetical protein
MTHQCDFSEYPARFSIDGEYYSLRSESAWLRRFKSTSGRFSVISRLLDGSFDDSLWDRLDPSSLSSAEMKDAGLAIKVSGRTDLPAAWLRLATGV